MTQLIRLNQINKMSFSQAVTSVFQTALDGQLMELAGFLATRLHVSAEDVSVAINEYGDRKRAVVKDVPVSKLTKADLVKQVVAKFGIKQVEATKKSKEDLVAMMATEAPVAAPSVLSRFKKTDSEPVIPEPVKSTKKPESPKLPEPVKSTKITEPVKSVKSTKKPESPVIPEPVKSVKSKKTPQPVQKFPLSKKITLVQVGEHLMHRESKIVFNENHEATGYLDSDGDVQPLVDEQVRWIEQHGLHVYSGDDAQSQASESEVSVEPPPKRKTHPAPNKLAKRPVLVADDADEDEPEEDEPELDENEKVSATDEANGEEEVVEDEEGDEEEGDEDGEETD
jgi:hypothetical protein